jgi:hypothetical protein
MTDDEFFALHPQPELVVGHAYPTLIFPDDVLFLTSDSEDDTDDVSIYAFPPKPEKYKRQYAVDFDLTDIPPMVWEFDEVVVVDEEEDEEEEEDLSDLPELIDDCNIRCPDSHYCWSQKQIEASYTLSVDEIEEEIQKSLAGQYNLVDIIKRNKKDEEERMQKVAKDRRERMQIINDGEMRRFSILQDKKEQERVQGIKDRNERCFRTLEKRKDGAFR